MGRLMILICLLAMAAPGCRKNKDPVLEPGAKRDRSFMEYIMAGDQEAVRDLVAKGEDVNAKHNGEYPVLVGIQYGQFDVVRSLINLGAKLDIDPDQNPVRTKGGESALHLVMGYEQQDLAEYLIEHGAQIKARTTNGNSTLHLAAGRGDLPATKLLISRRADLNDRTTNRGNTPLMDAVQFRNLEVARYLIISGADVNLGNWDQKTALDIAIDQKDQPLIDLLNRNHAKLGKDIPPVVKPTIDDLVKSEEKPAAP